MIALLAITSMPSSNSASPKRSDGCSILPLTFKFVGQSAVANPMATSPRCIATIREHWHAQLRPNDDYRIGEDLILREDELARMAWSEGRDATARSLWRRALEDYALLETATAPGARGASRADPEGTKLLETGHFRQAFAAFGSAESLSQISNRLLDKMQLPARVPPLSDALTVARAGRLAEAENMFVRLAHASDFGDPAAWFFVGATQLAQGHRALARASFMKGSVHPDYEGATREPIVTWSARCAYALLETS